MGKAVMVCEAKDIPSGTIRSFDVDGEKIMIANVNGIFYATGRICTHATADLSRGFLMGAKVTCPLHLSQFDLKTGKALTPPATKPIKTYPVKIEESSLIIEL